MMDLRKHSRITAESKCKASFTLGGQSYKDIPVSNLGADGCCFEIPSGSSSEFKKLAQLEAVELSHPDLPHQALQAKVVWVHGKRGAEKDLVETGIQFSGVPDGYCQEVDRYVSTLLKFKPRMSM
jgi:hypothetical protein